MAQSFIPVRENIQHMQGYAPGEQPTDPTVIKLNTNENPYPPSPRVLEAIAAVTADQLRRYPSPDARVFREAAAEVHGLTPEHIITVNGGDELLAYAVRAAAAAGDGVAYTVPSYSLYPVLADMQGARHVHVRFAIDNADWHMPEDAFDHLSGKAGILLITNPNAPSGTLLSEALLRRALERFRGLVLVDEAYVNFARRDALSLVHEYANLLLLRTMSKGFSLAGIRFGYGVGSPKLISELHKVRDSYPCDAVSIAAATAALKDLPYAASTWELIKTGRGRVAAELKEMGFTLPESQTNFVLAYVPEGHDAAHLYEGLKQRHILVRYFRLPHLTNALRITIGTPQQNNRLLEELKALTGR